MHDDANPADSGALRADLDRALARIQQLEFAVETHGRIGQAMGILMRRYSICSDAAFAALCRVSQHHNIKLRTLAESVIETVTTPDCSMPREIREALEELLRHGGAGGVQDGWHTPSPQGAGPGIGLRASG